MLKTAQFTQEEQKISANDVKLVVASQKNYQLIPGGATVMFSGRGPRIGGAPVPLNASQGMGCCSQTGFRRWMRFIFLAFFCLIAIVIPYFIIHESHTMQRVYLKANVPLAVTLEDCRFLFYDPKESHSNIDLFIDSDTAGKDSKVDNSGKIILRNSQDYTGSCFMNLEIPQGAVLSGGLSIQCIGTCVRF